MDWFTSDLHFGHDKKFLYEPRGFGSIKEHDDAILRNINSCVSSDDTLYILGDLMLNDNDHGLDYLSKLNGHKKIIIGNHDTDTRIELYKELDNVEILGYSFLIKSCNYNFLISHYPTICGNKDEDKKLKSRVINLFGHTHSKYTFYDDNPLMYNVSLDAHNNYPISTESIIKSIINNLNIKECLKSFYETKTGDTLVD